MGHTLVFMRNQAFLKSHERPGRSRHSGGSSATIESAPNEEQSHCLISTILKPKLMGQAAKNRVLGRINGVGEQLVPHIAHNTVCHIKARQPGEWRGATCVSSSNDAMGNH